jgi:hypothetical protein
MKPVEQLSAKAWNEEIAILEAGVPSLPAEIGDDEAVPIARWVGPRFGAVLFVMWSGASDDLDRYLSSEIYVFQRHERGWESVNTGGGGGWFDPPFVRPGIDADSVSLAHFHSGRQPPLSAEGVRWTYSSAYGYAGTAAKTVEVEDDDGLTQREIESPMGVFIVVAGGIGRAVVRIRRGDGSLLLEYRRPGAHYAVGPA